MNQTVRHLMDLRPQIHAIDLPETGMATILSLGQACQSAQDVPRVLNQLVIKIAGLMSADVCSLYLVDKQNSELVLRATMGLNPESVNQVRLKPNEGLVGKTLEWQKPVSMSVAKKSKQFKFIPETGEQNYNSFLSVPLVDNRQSVGVLVIQHKKQKTYSKKYIQHLLSLTMPIVSVIERAKLVGTLGQVKSAEPFRSDGSRQVTEEDNREGVVHRGIGASAGIAIAPVRILCRVKQNKSARPNQTVSHPEVEKVRVLEAFRWVEEEIRAVQRKAEAKLGLDEASIFEAYQMVLSSEPFKQQVLDEIDQGLNALESVEKVVALYAEELSHAEDDYIRDRRFDVEDLGRKITDCLEFGGEAPRIASDIPDNVILFSEHWSITDFVEMDLSKVKGILSSSGGATSHIAILVESLNIPAVLGLPSLGDQIADGDLLILDGSSGVVIVRPTKVIIDSYEAEQAHDEQVKKIYEQKLRKTTAPLGGRPVEIGANIGMVAHLDQAVQNHVDFIGLYRTEFPFLIRRTMPTEEEQFELYKKVIVTMKKKPVTIRTLDIGGDKYLPYLKLPDEANPFLGWRSIRISLDRTDLFRIQLRAILRASAFGSIRLLFPMISALHEIRLIKEIVADVTQELTTQKMRPAKKIPLGIMIEVPAAVEMAPEFIKEVDFFSIGSNDLTQYVLAVDRNNPKVAQLYDPFHPAVLRMIQRTVAAVKKAKKSVSVCGEMAANPFGAVLLVGMGIEELSMSAPQITKIKSLISKVQAKDIRQLVSRVLRMSSATEIKAELQNFFTNAGLDEYISHSVVR